MGWLFSIGLFVAAITIKSETMMIASGLFAIAGAIAFAFTPKNTEKEE